MRVLKTPEFKNSTEMKLEQDTIDDNPYARRLSFCAHLPFPSWTSPLPPFSLSPSHVQATLSQPIPAHRKNVTVLCKLLRVPRILLDPFAQSESFVWREKPRVHIFPPRALLLQGMRCSGRNDREERIVRTFLPRRKEKTELK